MASASEFGDEFIKTIDSKDPGCALLKIEEFKKNMKDPTIGAEYVAWISEPSNLTKLHNSLIDNLQIPPRLLSIKRAQMPRARKVALLVQAMELAIRRVHNLGN